MQKDSDFIKKLRFDYHLTQQQLADAVGVTKGYIGQVENENSKLSEKIYNKITTGNKIYWGYGNGRV